MSLPLYLGTENIKKLLWKFAIPAIIAMMASSLYNIADTFFIGKGVGALGITAIALTFPFMNISAAFGTLVGIGASTLVSVKLGEKDYDTARRILGNVMVLNFIIGGLFAIIALIFLDPILIFFGASPDTLPYSREYMEIILYGNIITHIYYGQNAVFRSAGHPKRAMLLTCNTVVLNCILDPLFIFVFGWSIKGAAIATVLSQLVSLIIQMKLFMNKNELLHYTKDIFWLDAKIVKESMAIGLAPFLMNLASCFVVILCNQGLKTHGGDMAIGANGLIHQIVFVFFMFVMGLNQGMQPVAGYNYGAKQYKRVLEVFKLTTIYATIVLTFGFAVCELFPRQIISIFTDDQELIGHAVYGIRLVMSVFPILGAQVVISHLFQSLGLAKRAILLSLLRQVVFLIPFLFIFPHFWGITGVWLSMPASDLVAAVISALLMIQLYKSWKQKGYLEAA
jgi:putative MATE family efflux protein